MRLRLFLLITLISFLTGCKDVCSGHGHFAGCKDGYIVCDDGFITNKECANDQGQRVDGTDVYIHKNVSGEVKDENQSEE